MPDAMPLPFPEAQTVTDTATVPPAAASAAAHAEAAAPANASSIGPESLAASNPVAASLDRGAHPLDDIDPAFPPAAGSRGGSVTLRLVISATGVVEDIAVVRAVPPGVFDDAALAAFGHARFAPGMRGGVAVRSEVVYEVEFAPQGRGTDSAGRSY